MLGQERQPFVDPAAIRAATQQSILSIVLPSSNVCRAEMETVRIRGALEIFELFRDYRIEGQTILDVFLRVIRVGRRTTGDQVMLVRCSASETCQEKNIGVEQEWGTMSAVRRTTLPN